MWFCVFGLDIYMYRVAAMLNADMVGVGGGEFRCSASVLKSVKHAQSM